MKLTELFLDQLQAEAALSRRTLERLPEGQNDWKPHEKSMQLGYLASLVASLPLWIVMTVNRDEFDLYAPYAAEFRPGEWHTSRDLVDMHDGYVARAREALANTTDDHLMKPWKFMVNGHVVSNQPRYLMLRDSVFSHLAHHRGQLTVYLRLNDAPVPALYGPSADEPFKPATAER